MARSKNTAERKEEKPGISRFYDGKGNRKNPSTLFGTVKVF